MHHDAPAALPLFALVIGLTVAPSATQPFACASALVLAGSLAAWLAHRRAGILVRSRRTTRPAVVAGRRSDEDAGSLRTWTSALQVAAALATGILLGATAAATRRDEIRTFRAFDRAQFAAVAAPLNHDWSRRGSSWLLQVDHFRANGTPFDRPLLIYTGFDPPPLAFSQSIVARGFLRRTDRGTFVLTIKSPRLMHYSGTLPTLSPARLNRTLAMRIAPFATIHPAEVALTEALVLGRSERLTDEIRDGFRRGGTYHLLVFSGLQIAIAAGAIAWLLRLAHAPRASDWLLLLFAILAPPFIGPTASVSRASIGIAFYAVSRIARRPTSMENLWCMAAIARLLAVPADLADPAFRLTYAGAGSLLFIAKPFKGRAKWIVAPIAAEVAIVPLTLSSFHQYAIGGSVVTIAMTPVILAMLLVALAACLFPSDILFCTIGLLHTVCGTMNDAGAVASGFFAAPPPSALAAAFIASLAAIAAFHGRRRAVAIALLLAVPSSAAIMRSRFRSEVAATEMTALDVGQGDSILVRAGGRVLLVDGGGRNDSPRFGENVLLPLLVDRGVRHIDVLALTHAHPDHCGGLPAVIEHIDVGSIWITPRRFTGDCAGNILAAAIRKSVPVHIVRDGDRLSLPPLHATALVAGRPFRRAPENNSSLVLRIQSGVRRILLTGDIESEAEAALASRLQRCDILKVAHHGSRSSSTPAFLDAVRPRMALISCGRDNRFGHPHPAVLEALHARSIRLWRTDCNGSVIVTLRDGRTFSKPEIDMPQ